MSRLIEEQAIRFLRGEENPFDAFVVPDKPSRSFAQCHVDEIHGDQVERICRVIDKYRHPEYVARGQLHESRVLIVRGVRGSGKTHLLHVLSQREELAPEIWVCPHYYDAAFPFAEYLLAELVRTLLSSDEAGGAARLRWCARALGRRLLTQALAAVGPQEWHLWIRAGRAAAAAAQVPEPTSRRAALRGSWPGREQLLETLIGPEDGQPLSVLCARHGLTLPAAAGLAIRHIERCETGSSVAARLRREVLLGFAHLALRDDISRLAAVLEQEFAQSDSALPPSRADVVTALLETLAEVLAAVRVPIIFAFDNMERLLAPRGPVDMPTAQSFFNGLAHMVDQTRGLLLVLLVERGLWNEFGQAINSFADHRLRQGVRVRDYGCIWDLELTSPTPADIERVVQRRMAPLLARAPHGRELPPCFPFQADEVRGVVAGEADVLRTALLRLRDRYDQLVLPADQHARAAGPAERPPAAEVPAWDSVGEALQRTWQEAVAAGRKRLEGTRRAALSHALHVGLGRWLDLMLGQSVGPWRLTSAQSAVPFGDHPTFGLVTLGTWQAADGSVCRVALGPLLGEGRMMPKDLQTKLTVFTQRPPLAEQLVVLWTGRDGTISPAQLPPATRQTWEDQAAQRPVRLCPLGLDDFGWLLSLPTWVSQEAAEADPQRLAEFVRARTAYLLSDAAPNGSPAAEGQERGGTNGQTPAVRSSPQPLVAPLP